MRRIRLLGLAIVSVLAVAAVAASAASAEHPPLWQTGGAPLPEGQVLPVLGLGELQSFIASIQSIRCEHVDVTGSVWNTPTRGLDLENSHFIKCKVFKGEST